MAVRHIWYSYVRGMVRQFPALDKEIKQIEPPCLVRSAESARSAGSRVRRPTEGVVLRRAGSATRLREHDAVAYAISQADPETLNLIRLVFWDSSHTLEGAALSMHISYGTAKNWVHEFLMDVAGRFGLLE